MYVGFMDLKGYDKVNREALWWVLRIYDVGGKLLNRTKGKYLNLICVGVKGDESECFRIDSGMRQSFIMPPLLFNIYY